MFIGLEKTSMLDLIQTKERIRRDGIIETRTIVNPYVVVSNRASFRDLIRSSTA